MPSVVTVSVIMLSVVVMAVTAPEFLTCRRGGKKKNVVVVVKVVLIVINTFWKEIIKTFFRHFLYSGNQTLHLKIMCQPSTAAINHLQQWLST
jgi:hypothetical protein